MWNGSKDSDMEYIVNHIFYSDFQNQRKKKTPIVKYEENPIKTKNQFLSPTQMNDM